jgi:hypothetical protein
VSNGITADFHRANLVYPMLCVQQFVPLCSNGLHWLICGVYSGFLQWYNGTSNGKIAGQSNGHFSGQSRRMAVGAVLRVYWKSLTLKFFFFFLKIILAFKK